MADKKPFVGNRYVSKGKTHTYLFIATMAYGAFVLYLMFFGFGRTESRSAYSEYTFILVPEEIPLRFPELTMSWVYDFGNIAAFIPFGIALPLLAPMRYGKFICFFLAAISSLEVLQSVSFLGTFDVADIIANTLGATIGFVAYQVGFSSKHSAQNLLASAVSIAILLAGTIAMSEAIHYGANANKRLGPLHALQEANANPSTTENLSAFSVRGEKVQPKFHLLRSGGEAPREYVFHVGKKDFWFYASCGIPDGRAYKGSVKIEVDGQEWVQMSDRDQPEGVLKVKSFFEERVEDVRITVTGNARVWDVSIAEIKRWWE